MSTFSVLSFVHGWRGPFPVWSGGFSHSRWMLHGKSFLIHNLSDMELTLRWKSVVVLLSLQPIYLAEIYHFKAGAQGLASLGSFVGVSLGALCCGYFNDLLSHRLAKRNHGVFEPEMRIPVIIFPTVIVPLGLILFSVGIKNEWHWIGPVIGAGMVNFGLPSLPAIMSPYIMDSYYPLAMDCLIVSLNYELACLLCWLFHPSSWMGSRTLSHLV